MKGKKTCPTCGKLNALRSSRCIGENCTHKFYETEEEKSFVDWHKLEKGQTFRTIIGSGPYFDPKDGGERQYLGHYDTFEVMQVQGEGILARSPEGTCFIYMGDDKPSKVVGTLSAHRIKLIKKRERAEK